jgi:DNA-binding transcriptional LysR family regulator
MGYANVFNLAGGFAAWKAASRRFRPPIASGGMTLEQLRIFLAVAEREHVTQAAKALNLTQSAVSSAIGALEDRHGVKLFDRIGRRIALTQAGRIFVGEARAVMASSRRAEQILSDLGDVTIGALTLAASQTVGNYWLPERLARFARAYPGVTLSLTIGNTEEVAALAEAGDIDFGLVEGETDFAALKATAIDEDELVVVAAPDFAAARKIATAAALVDAPWVAREKGSGTRAAFEQALQMLDLGAGQRRIVLELPSNEAVRSAVEAGAGLAVMSRLVARASIQAGALAALPFKLPRRPFYLLAHRERHRTRAAEALLKEFSPPSP